jgi:hypothetical protein
VIEKGEPPLAVDVRRGHRKRGLTGTLGRTEISVPRARPMGAGDKTSEWKSASLAAHRRRARAADALIAGTGESRNSRQLKLYVGLRKKEPSPFNVVGRLEATPAYPAPGVLAERR